MTDPTAGTTLNLMGHVVIGQSDTDPGDMGEPRHFTSDGTHYVTVPSFRLWAAEAALTELADAAEQYVLSSAPEREDLLLKAVWKARGSLKGKP